MNYYAACFAVLGSLFLTSCSWFDEPNDKPWIGYAKQKNGGKYISVWNGQSTTRRDCVEKTEYDIERPDGFWTGLTGPVVCGYSGENYWLSAAYYMFFDDRGAFECLARHPSRGKGEYGPVPKGDPRRTDSYYCL